MLWQRIRSCAALAGGLAAWAPLARAQGPPLVFEQDQLVASDASEGQNLAWAVALDGDTLVLGAPRWYSGSNPGPGSAYVYVRSGTSWVEQAQLVASDGVDGDWFGLAVALEGDTVVVGAPRHDGASTNSGALYVFARSGAVWSEVQRLTASDGGWDHQLGVALALENDRLVAGAQRGGSGAATFEGAAYVFERGAGSWSEQAKLLAGDGTVNDSFGESVALSGDTILVGAPGHDAAASGAGAAYVYTGAGVAWALQGKLLPSPAATNDSFGESVALDGDLALVGAAYTNKPGYACVYARSGAQWSEERRLLAGSPASWAEFGKAVALEGETAVVGAPSNGAVHFAGMAYVFERDGGAWPERAWLLASDATAGDFCGAALAIDGDTVGVGAWRSAAAGPAWSGCAYIFGMRPAIGDAYCTAEPNSTGLHASIYASGSLAVADNDVVLTASGMPLQQFGYFLAGQGNGEVFPVPGTQGRFCLAGAPAGRFNHLVESSGAAGAFATVIDVTQMPMGPPVSVAPGETWNFQCWYRDKNPSVTSNFTDAVGITFQ